MSAHPLRIASLVGLVVTVALAAGESGMPTVADPMPQVIAFSEVTRKVVILKDRTVTLIRVRPPALPKAPLRLASRPVTPQEQADSDRMEKKAYAMLTVSATVYLGENPVTELRWRNETGETEYRAFSNVDFRYLTQLSTLETDTTVYAWFPFVDVCDLVAGRIDQASPIPGDLTFSATEAEYFVDARAKDIKGQETTLAGLDYLHAYYQLHYKELKADYEKREAENAARENELRKHPPQTPDVTLYFWPIKSRANPQ